MRVGLFTNNYLPFRGGVTTAVATLRQGLEAFGHDVWIFAPGSSSPLADLPRVFRYPSVPAPTYPGFSLPLPVSPRLARVARGTRPRRRACPAPVPARRHRAAAGAAARTASRLHVPHALREVRPLRAAAGAGGGGAGGSPRLPVRELRGPGDRPIRAHGGHAGPARGPGACRRRPDGRAARSLHARRPASGPPDARVARG